MATYKGIAASTWGKAVRDSLKWKKVLNPSNGEPIHYLYRGKTIIGWVYKSKFKDGKWMWNVNESALAEGWDTFGYVKDFQSAKKKVLRVTNLEQFYKKR